jgi:hypothetical protein
MWLTSEGGASGGIEIKVTIIAAAHYMWPDDIMAWYAVPLDTKHAAHPQHSVPATTPEATGAARTRKPANQVVMHTHKDFLTMPLQHCNHL